MYFSTTGRKMTTHVLCTQKYNFAFKNINLSSNGSQPKLPQKWGNFGCSSGAPLDKKWKFRLRYCWFRAFSPNVFRWTNFKFMCEGDPATGQPFTLRRFFSKIGGDRVPQPLVRKFFKKIAQVGINVLLQITEFGRCSSNRSRDILTRNFWENSPIFSEFR